MFLNGNTLKLDSIRGKFVFFREEIDLILSIHGKIVFFYMENLCFLKMDKCYLLSMYGKFVFLSMENLCFFDLGNLKDVYTWKICVL